MTSKLKEGVMQGVFTLCACVSILAVALICIFLFANGVPTLFKIGPLKFLLGTTWKPGNDIFGILPMILGSIYVTAGAILVGVPIGLFFGRCANFINGELWGAPTDMPWGVVFGGAAGTMPRHPSQLYEALLEGVVLFIILFALSRKTPARPRGTFFGTFLLFYGLFRFTIEFIRQPDAQIGYLLGTHWFTMGQALSIPLMVAGVAFLIYAWKTKKPQMGLPDSEISQS